MMKNVHFYVCKGKGFFHPELSFRMIPRMIVGIAAQNIEDEPGEKLFQPG